MYGAIIGDVAGSLYEVLEIAGLGENQNVYARITNKDGYFKIVSIFCWKNMHFMEIWKYK